MTMAYTAGGVSFTQDCKNKNVEQMEQKMINLRNQWGRTKKTYGSGKYGSKVKSVQVSCIRNSMTDFMCCMALLHTHTHTF